METLTCWSMNPTMLMDVKAPRDATDLKTDDRIPTYWGPKLAWEVSNPLIPAENETPQSMKSTAAKGIVSFDTKSAKHEKTIPTPKFSEIPFSLSMITVELENWRTHGGLGRFCSWWSLTSHFSSWNNPLRWRTKAGNIVGRGRRAFQVIHSCRAPLEGFRRCTSGGRPKKWLQKNWK